MSKDLLTLPEGSDVYSAERVTMKPGFNSGLYSPAKTYYRRMIEVRGDDYGSVGQRYTCR